MNSIAEVLNENTVNYDTGLIDDVYFRGYAKIDLDAIVHNIKHLNSKSNSKYGTIAVIKTDGYGHGAVPIAKTIDEYVFGYAVATVFEGVNLRKHGITKPIIILGYTNPALFDLSVKYDCHLAVYDYETAQIIDEHAKNLGKIANINIVVDTGMSRIGFLVEDENSYDEIIKISKLENVNIDGIFTHFAKADYRDKTSAYSQFEAFKNYTGQLEKFGVFIKFRHCANSAAMMEMDDTALDLSRAGISMYGLYPSEEIDKDNTDIKPVLSLYSHVTDVKTINPGRGVSYGHTYIASKETKVATIPLGYGDGYKRNLSNRGFVIIKDHKCPIIGRVCMDQFMVDVTGLDVNTGDKVTLIGESDNSRITVEELAELAGTFNYEFVCDIGKRVPRVYVKGGKIVGCKDYFYDDYKFD